MIGASDGASAVGRSRVSRDRVHARSEIFRLPAGRAARAPRSTCLGEDADEGGLECTQLCTLRRMAKHVPVREFRRRLSELLDDVADRRDHILVTRNGKPAAALVPVDEYQALEEAAEILSDRDAIDAIETGLAELNRGETVTLDALRVELAERRPASD